MSNGAVSMIGVLHVDTSGNMIISSGTGNSYYFAANTLIGTAGDIRSTTISYSP